MDINGRFYTLSEHDDLELSDSLLNASAVHDDDERLLLLFTGLAPTSDVEDLVEAADKHLRDC